MSVEFFEKTVGTVDELGKRLGSRAAAKHLLDRLQVPVIDGVFSRRLLLERLEAGGPEQTPETPKAIRVASAALLDEDVAVIDWRVGRPTTLRLKALRDRTFGWDDFGEVLLAEGEEVDARLYSAEKRTSAGKASFTASGFDSDSAEPIYLFVLVEEERVWGLTARELSFVAKEVQDEAKAKRSELSNSFVKHSRPGAVRVAFPRQTGDWDLSGRFDLETAGHRRE
ncbi:MAG: hypothetical protein JJ863_17480 [Deltaproteobacteria bacterium]|nr:hypothetical protein [Deltaproteobacteria bacterium]